MLLSLFSCLLLLPVCPLFSHLWGVTSSFSRVFFGLLLFCFRFVLFSRFVFYPFFLLGCLRFSVNSYVFNVIAEASLASACCPTVADAADTAATRASDSQPPRRLSLTAIRSGDYFMFEEYSDDGLAELEYQEKKSDEKDDDPGGMTVSKVISTSI